MLSNSALPLIILEDVQDAVHVNLPNLKHGQLYTLEELVGRERWQATHRGHRNQLGAEYKHQVLTGDEPVRWVKTRTDNRQMYELK